MQGWDITSAHTTTATTAQIKNAFINQNGEILCGGTARYGKRVNNMRLIDADELKKQFPVTVWATIDRMPTIEPEPHWIPVTERLPEVGTYVLVSKKAFPPNVCMAHRSRDPRSGKEAWNDMLFGELDDNKVLAWMPLPEPWKEGGQE